MNHLPDSAPGDGPTVSPGWLLLHCPASGAADDEAFADLLAQLGLWRGEGSHLLFGGTSIEWIHGNAARDIAMDRDPAGHRSIGIDVLPDLAAGKMVAFRALPAAATPLQNVQRLCAAASMVAAATGAAGLYWAPARLWSSVGLFAAAVVASERQGLPPVMHLVGFDATQNGVTSVASDGLAWFCGHELRLTAPSGYPVAQALRRAARLAVDAMVHRGLEGPMRVAGIEQGEELEIGPRSEEHGVPVVRVELCPLPG